MKQASLGLTLTAKQTLKQVFLDQMDQVVPWAALVELLARITPRATPVAQLQELARLPDESTILRFRHRLEKYKLATVNEVLVERGLLLKVGTVVDVTLIAAPSSTKNKDGLRDPEMHSAQKGNQWHFGMKAHIGADADSGLVHTESST